MSIYCISWGRCQINSGYLSCFYACALYHNAKYFTIYVIILLTVEYRVRIMCLTMTANPQQRSDSMVEMSDYEMHPNRQEGNTGRQFTTLEAASGNFLPHAISDNFRSMDASDVAEWLESIGEEVVSYMDTGRNGLAITYSGYKVSTNGYVSNLEPGPVYQRAPTSPHNSRAGRLNPAGRTTMTNRPQINFRIIEEDRKRLEHCAETQGRSISNLLNRIVSRYLDRWEKDSSGR